MLTVVLVAVALNTPVRVLVVQAHLDKVMVVAQVLLVQAVLALVWEVFPQVPKAPAVQIV